MLFLNALWQSFDLYKKYYRTVCELQALSDEELADLNINRFDIHNVAAQAILKTTI
jgi:uncharacterized protein YjiS (DUF1127 family)